MKRLRGKLTYANVVSTLCLCLLVGGGTAFAASQMLPKNSVGAKQLKKGAVTPAKLSAGAKSALTGPAGPKGATGAEGPRGERGERGEPGPSTGAAGGALTGSYPNPELSTSARGVAIAGMTWGTNLPLGPSVRVWFNRLGGVPTVEEKSTGIYKVTFPGINANIGETVIVSTQGPSEDLVSASSTEGSLFVSVRNSSGTLVNNFFSLMLFPASKTG